MSQIEPFEIAVPQTEIDDLKRRLESTRWPERETVGDWSQGAPLAKVKALCDHWRTRYDWRRLEARLNGLGQYRTEIKGLPIHFIHVRSPEPNALPLLMTHGWPGSVIEFLKVIGPLTDPAAHGGKASDAFHLILPSLPGFGFSGKPAETGWGVRRTANAWAELMARLGYGRYVAQGGDWGAAVTTALGAMAPRGLEAIHVNMPIGSPDMNDQAGLAPAEKAKVEAYARFMKEEAGYLNQQMTRPQTLGYGLADSASGQAAWIYEKFCAWTDCGGEPENILSLDELLDNISVYWFTGTGASSARMYWESSTIGLVPVEVDVPTGISIFPKEVLQLSRRLAEKSYRNVIHWNELDKGGHFAAFEQPDLFVEEIRTCFRSFQKG